MTHFYSVPGSAESVICEEHLRPENTVEMPEANPDPNLYVASHDGTWVIRDMDTARRMTILRDWPVHTQLEALTEYLDGRPAKLEALKAYIHEVKSTYPK